MKNCYTPKKNSLLVALASAAIVLLSSIPTVASVQLGAVRHISSVDRNYNDLRATSYALNTRAVNNRPPVKKPTRPDPKALHAASLRGDLRMVQRLVKERVDVNYANGDRETALHMAASRGHLSIVIFLLRNGANMTARTTRNWIPLHHAVRFNRQNVANYLMAKGSPANYQTLDRVNSLDIALAMRNQRMIGLVKRYMR